MLAPLLSRIERERIDRIKLLLLSLLMLLLFLLGIAVLLKFVGPVHLTVKGKLISSTLLLLRNVSSPYPKKASTTSVTPAFPHLLALMARLTMSSTNNSDLQSISEWGTLNLVKFNTSKTQLLTISLSNTPSNYPIVFEDSEIPPLNSVNILELQISSRL